MLRMQFVLLLETQVELGDLELAVSVQVPARLALA